MNETSLGMQVINRVQYLVSYPDHLLLKLLKGLVVRGHLLSEQGLLAVKPRSEHLAANHFLAKVNLSGIVVNLSQPGQTLV